MVVCFIDDVLLYGLFFLECFCVVILVDIQKKVVMGMGKKWKVFFEERFLVEKVVDRFNQVFIVCIVFFLDFFLFLGWCGEFGGFQLFFKLSVYGVLISRRFYFQLYYLDMLMKLLVF